MQSGALGTLRIVVLIILVPLLANTQISGAIGQTQLSAVDVSKAAGTQPLAQGEITPGILIRVTRLERLSGYSIVELRFDVVNNSDHPVTLDELRMQATNGSRALGQIQLFDPGGTTYFIGSVHATPLSSFWNQAEDQIGVGEKRSFWAWFGAPPAGVNRLALEVPGVPPILDIPLGRR